MRKSKPLDAGQTSAFGRRPVIRSLDDGILAVPIPSEERDNAHEEMRDLFVDKKKKTNTTIKVYNTPKSGKRSQSANIWRNKSKS